MSRNGALGLFEGFGIEAEYMIVAADDLAVLPVGDRLLARASGRLSGDVERGEAAWSNELVLHLLEMKTNGPRPSLDGLSDVLAGEVQEANRLLEPLGGRLLATGMHPFMDPQREARLWPHEYNEVYRTYDRIFGCRGHGFGNLQSVHVNLPFADDHEFARLHAAVRLVLPLLPGLAASTPLVEGRATGTLDNRLVFYRRNQRIAPSVTGAVIPERVYSKDAYERRIFRFIEEEIAPRDPEGILEPEWVNSRGAIARFVRNSIEIRLIDTQECPAADVAVAAAAVAVVRALVEERWTSHAEQAEWHESHLVPVFEDAVRDGGEAVVRDPAYLAAFGVRARAVTLSELWSHLVETLDVRVDGARGALATILGRGCLAKRILAATGGEPSLEAIRDVYGELADCLAANRPFEP
jgi:gamma-glutamyl:cysteine ligase YbdK (ATP-grasp superfamily)